MPILIMLFLKNKLKAVNAFNFEALGLNPPPLGGQALAVFSSSRGRDKIQH